MYWKVNSCKNIGAISKSGRAGANSKWGLLWSKEPITIFLVLSFLFFFAVVIGISGENATAAQMPTVCGDFNGNGSSPNGVDVTYLWNYLGAGGPPPPDTAADADDYHLMTIRDEAYLIRFLFGGGAAPVCPPSHGKYTPVLNTDFSLTYSAVLPANQTQCSFGIRFNRSFIKPIRLFDFSLLVRVDGAEPSGLTVLPNMFVGLNLLNVQVNQAGAPNGSFVIIGGNYSGLVSSGSDSLAAIQVTMPSSSPNPRSITLQWVDLPPLQGGVPVNYPMIVDRDIDGWMPLLVGSGSTSCPTQNYASSTGSTWKVPNADTTAYAMAFDAVAGDTLRSVSFSVYDPGDGSFGNDTIEVRLYADNAGLPGTLLDTKKVPPGTYPAYPSRCFINYNFTGISGGFHVGISTSYVCCGRYESIVSDSGTTGTARSAYFYQGQWYGLTTGGGSNHPNFDVTAELCSGSTNCPTQHYGGGPTYPWPFPKGDTTAYSMAFDAMPDDTLKSVSFSVYDPGDGSFGNDTIKVRLYSDNGLGLPDSLLDTKTVPPGTYPANPTKCLVNYAYIGLGPRFHVSISCSAIVGSGRYESILSDSGTTGTSRSYYFYQGQWEPISPGTGPDYNFDISVQLCHYPGNPGNGTIDGYKYNDLNHDGLYTTGEPGIQYWPINLYQGTDVFGPKWGSTTTNSAGYYSFTGVPYGQYYVSEGHRPHWVQTAPKKTTGSIVWSQVGTTHAPNFMNDSACIYPLQTQTLAFLAGDKDNFVGPEPSYPSPALQTVMYNQNLNHDLKWFDTPATFRGFGHTFQNLWSPKCQVVSATLKMQLKATFDENPGADMLCLGTEVSPYTSVSWGWKTYLSNLHTWATPPSVLPSWGFGSTMTVTLDLGNLPVPNASYPGSGSSNILSMLQNGGLLDVYIRDETEVDYLELTVELCCKDTCGYDTVWVSTAYNQVAGAAITPNSPVVTDPDWVVGVAPSTAGLGAAKVVGNLGGAWKGPIPTGYTLSNWITAFADPTGMEAAPGAYGGNYDFIYSFCADPNDTTRRLNFSLRTDNGSQVYMNKTLLGTTGGSSFSDLTPTPFSSVSVLPGANVITVRVNNAGPSYMGLNLYGFATANGLHMAEAECCSCYAHGDINGDGIGLTVTDEIALGQFLNGNGTVAAPVPLYEADLNGDGKVDWQDFKIYKCYIDGGGLACFPNHVYPVPTNCKPKAYYHFPGDADGNGIVNVSDVVYLIAYIFSGGPTPIPETVGDVDCNGITNISDVVYLISYVFVGSPAPCPNK